MTRLKIYSSATVIAAVVLLLCTLPEAVHSHKILMVMTVGPRSHKFLFEAIARALGNANHSITIVSPFKREEPIENVDEIQLQKDHKEKIFGENLFKATVKDVHENIGNYGVEVCLDALLNKEVEQVLRGQIDLAIFTLATSDCFLPTIYRKKIPFVYASYSNVPTHILSLVGNVEYSSISPTLFSEATYPMTILDSFYATFKRFLSDYHTSSMDSSVQRELTSRGYWGLDLPSLVEIKTNVSLVISNSVRTLENPPYPTVTNIIFGGGLHTTPPKKLEKELKDWLKSTGEDGFIYFSLGSFINTNDIKEEHLKIFIKVFSGLKQKVLMKWDSKDTMKVPKNVKLLNWFPQNDVLAHPNIRLFITHGGLTSLNQATYYAVPVLGMPICLDQFANVARATKEGWSLKLDWNELTEESLRESITKALNDKSMKSAMKSRSTLMKDQPLTPAQEVVFWLEYAIRHKGAHHLRCPLGSMRTYSIYNLDTFFILVLFPIIVIILIAILSKCYLNFRRR